MQSTYWDGRYLVDGLMELNWHLRDFRQDQMHVMDPFLFDLLFKIRQKLPGSQAIDIVSGYRSEETNEFLRQSCKGVAKKSYHTRGQALDFVLPKYSLAEVRKAAVAMRVGGVGYYPENNFIHLDTGRRRVW